MPDPVIPAGQAVFMPTATGFCDASAFPAAGLMLRATGEILIIGGGEAFAARLSPADLEGLGFIALALAAELQNAAGNVEQAASGHTLATSHGLPGNA